MAEKMTNGKSADGANKDHNIADIKKLIRNCASEMVEIKRERQALNERAGDIRKALRESGVETEGAAA